MTGAGRPAVGRPGWLGVALVAALGTLHLVAYGIAAARRGEALFGDFFGFWSFARFLAARPAAEIYDIAGLAAFQRALDPAFQAFYPFPYPPTFALLLRPLAPLPYLAAFTMFMGLGLSLYLAAAARGGPGRMARIMLAALAPASTVALIAGQNGYLTAGLLGLGLAALPRRPIVAGLLFGLLTFKPQMAALLPVALVAGRQWRALAAMALSAAAFAAASAVVFGPAMWRAWAEGLAPFAAALAQYRGALEPFMPTVTAALDRLGLPAWAVQAGQLAGAALAVFAVWRSWRPGPSDLAAAVLMTAGVVATPYAFVYDLPVVALALIMLWRAMAAERPPGWRIVLGLGFLQPLLPLLVPRQGWLMALVALLLLATASSLAARAATLACPRQA